MADRVEHMDLALTVVGIGRSAQHLAVDRDRLVRGAEVVLAERIDVTLQHLGGDLLEHLPDHRHRGYLAAALVEPASEVTAIGLAELIAPKMDALVAAGAGQCRRRRQRQHRRQRMATALRLPEVLDLLEILKQRPAVAFGQSHCLHSMLECGRQLRRTQDAPRIAPQRLDEHELDRLHRHLTVAAADATVAAGLTHHLPVVGPVDGAGMML